MTNLEGHVTSLELSKRLRELGVKQDSYFYWIDSGFETPTLFHAENDDCNQHNAPGAITWLFMQKRDSKAWSAFLASELGEILPSCIGNPHFEIVKLENTNQWGIEYICSDYHSGWHLKLCDAFAHMLIHLIKNDLCDEKWKAKWLEAE